jgi:23S rRNA pseudouridine1911/1915/1917 synthase
MIEYDKFTETKVEYIEQIFEFQIPKGQKSERIDLFLTRMIQNATRTKVQKAIDDQRVSVNGKVAKSSHKIKPFEKILCKILKPPPMELVPQNIPLEIVFEDNYLLVINKPAGMVVHPGFGNRYGTVVNAVLYHLGKREPISIELDEDEDEEQENTGEIPRSEGEGLIYASDIIRPGIVHRIDKDTSGLLVIAKDPITHANLAAQFSKHTIEREYWAIAWGKFKSSTGTIEGDIGRSSQNRKMFAVVKKDGKFARTDYFILKEFEFASLVKYKLHTGRTHQIRVHSSFTHHPILGDELYGGNKIIYGSEIPRLKSKANECLKIATRQMLHAKTLGFVHPKTQEKMLFDSNLADDFQKVLKILEDNLIS